MKPIRICEENRAAIEALLKEVNGKATTHTYTEYGEILYLADRAENAVASLLLKKDFVGAQWFEISGAHVANAYKYARQGTAVTLVRKSGGWHLIEARAAKLFVSGGGKGRLYLTEAQSEAAQKELAKRFTVMRYSASLSEAE